MRSILINSGIGLETALQFASEGALLYISDINEPAAQKAAEYITKEYPSSECQSIKCDVSSEADIKTLVESAVAKWGRLDVMVSNLLANTGECTDESSTMLVLCTDSMVFAIA
jgi:NAD(P)-dependent dehydrogenase (short-subunit alcohol dehydrogenase family)